MLTGCWVLMGFFACQGAKSIVCVMKKVIACAQCVTSHAATGYDKYEIQVPRRLDRAMLHLDKIRKLRSCSKMQVSVTWNGLSRV